MREDLRCSCSLPSPHLFMDWFVFLERKGRERDAATSSMLGIGQNVGTAWHVFHSGHNPSSGSGQKTENLPSLHFRKHPANPVHYKEPWDLQSPPERNCQPDLASHKPKGQGILAQLSFNQPFLFVPFVTENQQLSSSRSEVQGRSSLSQPCSNPHFFSPCLQVTEWLFFSSELSPHSPNSHWTLEPRASHSPLLQLWSLQRAV